MTEEIKEIIDYLIDEECTRRIKCITIEESKQLLDYIKNLQQENTTLIKNQINSNSEHFRIIKENKRKIDNLRKQNKELKSDIEVLERVKNFYKRHSLKYYRRCDVALAWIETTKEIIEQQPTEDDTWILDKLNSFENILNGSDEK